MFKQFCLVASVVIAAIHIDRVDAGYLDEDPDEVFSSVYAQLGIKLPISVARDPYVWLRLGELKREPCDQQSVNDLALTLGKMGYRRQAAEGLYNFVMKCGAPTSALQTSVNMLLSLTDYPKAVEVADEFIRRAPMNHNAHFLRGEALAGAGDFRRAIVDYANAIELFDSDKRRIGSQVFTALANAHAALGEFCEAATSILTWVALDPAGHDTNQSRKMVADYEQQGNCTSAKQPQKVRYPLSGQKNLVKVKAEINGVRGFFIIDTGATWVSIGSRFADRAKIPWVNASEVTLKTAHGLAKGRLSRAEKVVLGTLEATQVPVVVQKVDDLALDSDGLLGMSFLSRFEIQMASGYIEIRTRHLK